MLEESYDFIEVLLKIANSSLTLYLLRQRKHHRRNCNDGLKHGVITIIVFGSLLKALIVVQMN